MTSPKRVAFIIGAGARIGESVSSRLRDKGYIVALGSRNAGGALQEEGIYRVVVDAAKSESVQEAFSYVTAELGPPNVVIYNAASYAFPPNRQDPLALDLTAFQGTSALGLNVFTAAQQAVVGFRTIQDNHAPKAFIVTGTLLPFLPAMPELFTLDLQKAIEARLVEYFYSSYQSEGFRFHYATLVSSTGGIVTPEDFAKSGPTHAKVYDELIHLAQQTWDYRFNLEGEPVTHGTS